MKYYFVINDSQDLQKGQFLETLKKLSKNQHYKESLGAANKVILSYVTFFDERIVVSLFKLLIKTPNNV